MSDASLSESAKRAMSRLSVLVDEVLLDMDEESPYFSVEDVFAQLRFIYEEKKQPFYGQLTYQAWGLLIRGRLSALGFELVRRTIGKPGWILPVAASEAYYG